MGRQNGASPPGSLEAAARTRLESGAICPTLPLMSPADSPLADLAAERPAEAEGLRPSRFGPVLLVASVACLVGAGLLLWSQQGDAVFNDVVLAALAWCF